MLLQQNLTDTFHPRRVVAEVSNDCPDLIGRPLEVGGDEHDSQGADSRRGKGNGTGQISFIASLFGVAA